MKADSPNYLYINSTPILISALLVEGSVLIFVTNIFIAVYFGILS